MNRAILQQTLEFLEFCWRDVDMNDYAFERLESTIEALKAELEKPEPEPYAWVFVPHNELLWPDEVEHKTPCEATGYIPLYTKGTP